jgi:hypothetical protein
VPLLRRVATLRASLRSVLRTLRPSMRLTQKLTARGQTTQTLSKKNNLYIVCFTPAPPKSEGTFLFVEQRAGFGYSGRTRRFAPTTMIFRISMICIVCLRDVRVCVRRMEGRSVRSTERSEARNVPTLLRRGTPKKRKTLCQVPALRE